MTSDQGDIASMKTWSSEEGGGGHRFAYDRRHGSAIDAHKRSHKAAGFTLVELLVVVAILAVVLGLAAPSFARISQAAAVSSAVSQFMADMRFARSEGMRRGGGVVLCRSEDPESSAPTCAINAGTQDWATGWIVFHDLDGDSVRTASEPVLRVQARHGGIDTIASLDTTIFKFSATGRLLAPSSITSMQFGGASFGTTSRRVVCVSPGGRARIAGDGTTSCGLEG
jgi:type IV fimbrial biogenesis protein FimT